MFMFQTLKFIPSKVGFLDGEVMGILLFGAAGALWLLVPFWDRKSARGEKNKLINYAGLFVVMYVIAFTVLGWLL
jgi:quinol-cytochrome oxidoreductase complex cytochrome b subunit